MTGEETRDGIQSMEPAPKGSGRATLSAGVIWNLGSLAFLAIVGFLLNVMIGRVYGPEYLGIFNICFSIYIFYSQISSLGVHFSVLQAVSHNTDHDEVELDRAAASGVSVTAGVALAVALIAAASTPLISIIFRDVEHIDVAWLLLTPALWFLPINKVLYNIVNGANHMRTFAVLQSARYVSMIVCLGVFVLLGWPGYLLTLIITASEFLLLPAAFYCANRIVKSWKAGTKEWRKRHIAFGSRGFLAGAVAELNTRVDVLIIGALMNERWAGVYSVALLAFEGASQAIFAVRYNLNPHITRYVRDKDYEGLRKFSRKTILLMTGFMFLVGAMATIAYPFFVSWIMQDEIYMEAFPALIVLLLGQAVSAGFTSLNMVFLQANKPGAQSLYMAATLIVNAIGNLILVPIWGLTGAAIATAISYVFSAVTLVIYARTQLGIRVL